MIVTVGPSKGQPYQPGDGPHRATASRIARDSRTRTPQRSTGTFPQPTSQTRRFAQVADTTKGLRAPPIEGGRVGTSRGRAELGGFSHQGLPLGRPMKSCDLLAVACLSDPRGGAVLLQLIFLSHPDAGRWRRAIWCYLFPSLHPSIRFEHWRDETCQCGSITEAR
jgi:hypothetical protein